MAARVFATANSSPNTPDVRTNIAGSMTGDASQKAITPAIGTPITSRAAISGITPHEQNGDRPPKTAASKIMLQGEPLNAFDMSVSALLALA